VINDGNGLYERLNVLGPQGLVPIPLPLERAGTPAWSPDGRFIALDGVPKGTSAQGTDRLDLPRKLYLLSPNGWHLKPLSVNLTTGPSTPAWSPNGRWLAMATYPTGAAEGIWLIEVATGRLHLVLSRKDLGAPAWLPDGRTLIVPTGIDAIAAPELARNADVGLYVVKLPDLARLAAKS
jgi:Tol biopolymer transport system component